MYEFIEKTDTPPLILTASFLMSELVSVGGGGGGEKEKQINEEGGGGGGGGGVINNRKFGERDTH